MEVVKRVDRIDLTESEVEAFEESRVWRDMKGVLQTRIDLLTEENESEELTDSQIRERIGGIKELKFMLRYTEMTKSAIRIDQDAKIGGDEHARR